MVLEGWSKDRISASVLLFPFSFVLSYFHLGCDATLLFLLCGWLICALPACLDSPVFSCSGMVFLFSLVDFEDTALGNDLGKWRRICFWHWEYDLFLALGFV